ncbi:uncharacterized protein ATC70_010883 [Mucor velutinosus]|uniref:Uncharacterized protein n=1 Tax=Mucor velutinosus TaxID=708070 RepID=A0AAN7DJU5_9FUNG|nr:hypothetical protein ATC70_010883 [Mucor velutinosus]
MINHNTQLKKLKFILFPPSRFPCNSIDIHSDVKCSTKENHHPLNHEVANSTYRSQTRTGGTRVYPKELKAEEAQPRPLLSCSVATKVDQEQKEYIQSQITTCSTTLAQQVDCPTLIQSSSSYVNVNDDARGMTPLSVQDVTFDKTALSHKIHQKPIYDRPNHHDTKEIASSIRRCMLPFKPHYELEWPLPNHHTSSALTKRTWLQLDDQTSSGIERVRKLGFADLDVRLDDQLTCYINSLTGSEIDSVVIQVLFDHTIHGDDSQDATLNGKQGRLLRLRRIYWWSVSYNLARTCLPIP